MKVYTKISAANTEPTLALALDKAVELNAPIVVATTGGECALKLTEMAIARGLDLPVTVVTHSCGFREGVIQEVPEATLDILAKRGCAIVTAAHSLSGVERNFGSGVEGPATLIAQTLRMLCAGVKVCVEISAMALDAGKLPLGERVVAVAGTGRGADTAAVLTPYYTRQILKTKVHELLCMPE